MNELRYKASLKILTYYELYMREHISINSISKEVGASWRKISEIFDKYQESGDIVDRPRTGREPETSIRTKRLIINEVKKNPKTTLNKIKSDLNIETSKSTIQRVLSEEGLQSQYMKKKFYIPENAQKIRLNTAKIWEKYNSSFWNRVIWSDECNVVLGGPNDKIKVWRYSIESLIPDQKDTSEKFGRFSVGVWACFQSNGDREIFFYNGRLNANDYINILENKLIPMIKRKRGKYRPVFQQDNAPCHKAKITLEFLKKNSIEVLDWPPYSPDINPIENVWSLIKKDINQNNYQILSKNDLINVIRKLFYAIKEDILLNLSQSLPNRIMKLIKSKGLWINN